MIAVAGKSAEDIKGYEFDWLASDVGGHVAFFSTAGGGYAPTQFLRNVDEHDVAIDAILALKSSTVPRLAPKLLPGVKNIWLLMAQRGIFAFDSDPNGGPYRLVAAPEIPTDINDLPSQAVKVLSELKLNHIKFAIVSIISKDQLRQL